MYKNYFLFEKQVNEIKPLLLGNVIQKIFTYQKNEIVIELSGEKPLFLLINISPHLPYLLVQPAYNIKQHKYQLFDDLQDQVICDMYIQPYDKHIIIELERYKIINFFYGKQPNIFICGDNNSIISSFKTGEMPGLSSIEKRIDFRTTDWIIPDINNIDSLKIILKDQFAALNKTFNDEIIFRLGYTNNREKYNTALLKKIFQNIKNEIEINKTYIYRQNGTIKSISIFRLTHLETKNDITTQEFKTVNEAWQRFISEKTDQSKFDKLYKECVSVLKNKMDYLNRSLKHVVELENLHERKRIAELKGNLLLTFKNQIQIKESEVALENIFSDNAEIIRIKVNQNKSVSENAQVYFNKYKDIDKKQLTHDVKTNTLNHEIAIYSEINNKLISAKSLSEIKGIVEKLMDLHLLVPDYPSANKIYKPQSTFKHLVLEDDWQVYIGKSGENNDELTFNFANKQDFWFHAQGVPGSHVILKTKQKDQVPPHHILEQVAGIAAANSKAKHSATVPVIYTQARYVSRIRNAPKGTVNARNEKTIFVEPLSI